MFDKQKAIGLTCGIGAIVPSKFCSLEEYCLGKSFAVYALGLFLCSASSFYQLAGRVLGGFKPAGFPVFPSLQTLHSACLFRFAAKMTSTLETGAFNMTQTPQAKSAKKTIDTKTIVIDGCDATGLSVEVLYQTQALFSSIINQCEKHSDIKQLAIIGAMLIDFSVGTLEEYNKQFKAIHEGGAL